MQDAVKVGAHVLGELGGAVLEDPAPSRAYANQVNPVLDSPRLGYVATAGGVMGLALAR